MKYKVAASSLKGSVSVPSSKSHTIRALLFGLMGRGVTHIYHPLPSPDTDAMVSALQEFGAKVSLLPDQIEIEGIAGKIRAVENVIQSGNSGQVLRFMGALAALSPTYTILTGDHSIRHNRPVKPLLDALKQLGAFAVSSRLDDCAPIIVKGPIQPGKATLSGEDSQPVSALLMAASFLSGITDLYVTSPGEKPWIALTLSWLDRLGIKYENENFTHYRLFGNASYNGFTYTVPGDFSSAAFPIAAALITRSEITLQNIDMDDVQGDKKLIEVLIAMGAKMEWDPYHKTLAVKKGGLLKGQEIDVNDFIDALPILAVIACYAEGTTKIVNASIARKKESDRIHSMAKELKKMGAQIEEREEGLIISSSALHGAHLESHSDHRIAMSLAIAALGAEGGSLIEGVGCVTKSYPTFARAFQQLGAHFEAIP